MQQSAMRRRQELASGSSSARSFQPRAPITASSAFAHDFTRVPAYASAQGESPEFVVQDASGAWFYVRFLCLPNNTTTAIDNTRVGPYSQPSYTSSYQCSYTATPLQEYIDSLQQYSPIQIDWKRIPQGGQLTPVYIEFDLILLYFGSAISRIFTIGELAVDLASGDYQGGLGEALLDGAIGGVVKKVWKVAFGVPKSLRGEMKREWLEEITKSGVKKTLPE